MIGSTQISYSSSESLPATPEIPATLPLQHAADGRLDGSGGLRYRVYAQRDPEDSGITVVAVPLSEVDSDAAPAAARRGARRRRCPAGPGPVGVLRGAARAAAAQPHRGDRRSDRRRRPLATGQPGYDEDRGRTAGTCAERDARSPGAGVRAAQGQRRAPAPVPCRRLARAAHAASVDPRLRRAVSHGRDARRGRDADGDAPHRGRVQAHGRARRGSADAGAPRRGARAEPRSGRPRGAGARRRGGRARDGARARDRAALTRRRGRPRRLAPAAPGARQPAAQRASAHPSRHADRGVGRAGRPQRDRRRARPRRRPARRLPRAAVRPLLARRGRTRAGQGRRRPGAVDRRHRRRRARRSRAARATPTAAARCSRSCCPRRRRRRSLRRRRPRARGPRRPGRNRRRQPTRAPTRARPARPPATPPEITRPRRAFVVRRGQNARKHGGSRLRLLSG